MTLPVPCSQMKKEGLARLDRPSPRLQTSPLGLFLHGLQPELLLASLQLPITQFYLKGQALTSSCNLWSSDSTLLPIASGTKSSKAFVT